jgi:hypothetical protein
VLRTRLLALVAVAAAVSGLVLAAPPVAAPPLALAAGTPYNTFRQLTSDADWAGGTREHVASANGSLTLSAPVWKRTLGGTSYDWGRWTSRWISPGQSFTELNPSWNAANQAGTLIEVQARVRTASGRVSGFKVMARWTPRDNYLHRTSRGSQDDGLAHVSTDTVVADSSTGFTGYQLRVLLHRRTGTKATPTVRSLHAIATRRHATIERTGRLLPPRTLAVPAYSQMVHRGQYAQYGGGGEAWCSPTSLAMVLGYYKALPGPAAYAWVRSSYADRWVDEVARRTYDYGYQGTGNWPFNTGYAATRTTEAFVTRLDNLREAERFIASGIPLEASIAFNAGQLSGAPISSTPGHLVVIVGFTAAGNVVVNDPAAASDGSVRRVYDRAQFERAWLTRSAGTVYVVHDAAHPLPARHGNTNW